MIKLQIKTSALRFPEFREEWEKKKLGEVTFKVGQKNKDSIQYPIYSINNKEGFLPQGEQFDGMDSNIRGYDISLYKIIKKETFAYNPARINVGSIGFSGELNDIIISSLYVCFQTKKEIDNYFMFHFINTVYFNNSVKSFLEGGVREYLFFENFSKINFSFPSLPEQTRIASFFTAIDKKIAALKQKKSLLEQYKKGVMQKIFSRELRFKDDNGKEFKEWEEKKLGDVCYIEMGQSPESNSYNSDYIGIPLIQGNADIQNRISNPRNWTSQITKECQVGDLLLTVRAPVGAVAKSVHNACIGRGVCAIRNKSISSIEFLFQFLLDYETKWGSLEQGSTFTAISGNEIKKLKIILPSLAEQTKIANFLSALDDKINHTQKQLEKADQWKKGLLQQMFC